MEEVKPRYRYNHKTKECDQLFSFNTKAVVVTPFRNPKTGSHDSFELPFDSPFLDFYRGLYANGRGSDG